MPTPKSTRTKCKAMKADGTRCKRSHMENSDYCYSHGGGGEGVILGAPKGNVNAQKHGFYRPTFTDQEYADLLMHAEALGLADELAVARVRIRRMIAYVDAKDESLTPDEFARINSTIFTGLRTIGDLTGKIDGNAPDHWTLVLNQLSVDLGMDL